jgi:hypothetical protein
MATLPLGRGHRLSSVSKREQDGFLGRPLRGLWNEDSRRVLP